MPRNAATNRFIQRNANAAILANGTDGAAGNILSIPFSATLNPTAAVTLEIWHRPKSLKSCVLFDNSTTGVTNSYFSGVSADLSLFWYSTIGGAAKNITTTTSKLKLNEWNFITATYDGANVILMANGSIFGSLVATGALGTNSGPLRIGAYHSGGSGLTANGALYRPRVYSASCSLAEHQERYYRGITSATLEAALELDLDTDRGAGTTVLDLSGNGNAATLGAGASWSGDVPFKSRNRINGNKVRNGDFEYAPPFTAATTTITRYIDGTAGGSTTNDLFGWGIEGTNSTGSVSARFDTSNVNSGTYSMKVSTTATASACDVRITRNITAANVLQYGIRVTPNTDYDVSFYMQTVANSGSATQGAHVRIGQFNAAGASVTSTDSTKVQTTTARTLYTFRFTTSSTTTFLVPGLRVVGSDGAGTLIMDAWFDDLTITPVYPEGRVPANGNLVKNFDFEVVPSFVAATGTTQRWIDGTSGGSTTNATYKWGIVGGGTFAGQYDSSVAHGGLYSMKLSSLAVASQCSMTNTRTTNFSDTAVYGIRVLPNTSYTMTGWMKTNYVSGDATNGAALAVSERDAAGAGVVTNVGTYVKTTTDWTLYTVTFTTAANTVYLAFDHRVYGHQGTATLIMDAWFDDIYLAPTTNPGRVAIT